MSEKKSFVLYNDYIKHIERLSDEEAGQLFKALFLFSESGEVTKLSPRAEMAFSFISEQMGRDREKWEKIREKRVEAGRKGGKQSQANANFAKQSQANQAVNGTVTVTGTGTGNVINNNVLYKGGVGGNAPQPSPPKIAKKKYGEYKHILLTDTQYQKLIDDYGEEIALQYIAKVDKWIQLKGKSPYKDYNLAIRNWLKKDNVKKAEEREYESNSRIYEGLI